MEADTPLFVPLFTQTADADLAAEIAARIGMDLPDACVAGVAANARLLQRHADLLRGGQA
ncbi:MULTISPECIES: DUF4089 domain-containing protein [Sphingobium]|jgi:hypothetical protein|uniref:DUF4089 domain-containing protein n=1 Tax=Sphingobium yanoikuyae TaxID=13690 RepID=A0A0J9CZE1_SPHYA|nr:MULTISPECIES: DUF4089 domain-containing protein [Sphingobium]MAM37146.1 alpha/beta hydrolase [Erythrobacter sp.]ATP19983.1 hypothetical protein BV87_17345 [Sphingobium yanoikuyae]KMW29751.1 hypothetical protein BV87_11215 [Sphingobium yanoikuyae]MBR2267174.1 DUF4089 domain-containing protein [Sphingobium sp.]QCB39311.1 alpha/beta hydrolase [Sphingobium sp. PAMC28499]|tara:strand:- start:179 stop:358 length:180 start_codon:yes stop_codon:yes gene_type:complete